MGSPWSVTGGGSHRDTAAGVSLHLYTRSLLCLQVLNHKQTHHTLEQQPSPCPSPAAVGRVPERQRTDSAQVGRDGLPHPDAASAQALADGELNVEQRDPLEGQGDEVGDEEGPCKDGAVSRAWHLGRTITAASQRGDRVHVGPGAAVLNHLAASSLSVLRGRFHQQMGCSVPTETP